MSSSSGIGGAKAGVGSIPASPGGGDYRTATNKYGQTIGITKREARDPAALSAKIQASEKAEEARLYELKSGREFGREDVVREDIQSHQMEMFKLQHAPLGEIPGIPGSVKGGAGGFGDTGRPEYDPREAAAITQRMVAPQKRNLRQAYTEATASLGQIANPNVQALTLRNALEGYGMGLESAMVGARGAAESEYKEKRKEESWASDQQAKMMQNQYSALLAAWSSGKLGRQAVESSTSAQIPSQP